MVQSCREEYGIHTCDMRSSLTHLKSLYPPPTYAFEPDFAETDPLWSPDERESVEHRVARARAVLDAAFAEDSTCAFLTRIC